MEQVNCKQDNLGVIAVLAFLQVFDLLMSLFAFSKGVQEANPVLAYALKHGFFIEAKVGLAAFIVVAAIITRKNILSRRVVFMACLIMTGVAIFHLYHLPQLLVR